MNVVRLIVLLCLLPVLNAYSQTVNWNQYLGPDRNATVTGDFKILA